MEDFTPQTNQTNSQKPWLVPLAIVIAIIIVVGIVLAVVNRGNDNGSENFDQIQDQAGESQNNPDQSANIEAPGTLRGILLESDNEKLGNLVLVRLGGDIYLRTSRDFSNFLNQEVVVKIDGDLEKFRLVDIELD
jgi:hypothetical protein